MSLTEFDEEEFIRNRREEGREDAIAEMQPIIDQKDAEIAMLRAKIAELQLHSSALA